MSDCVDCIIMHRGGYKEPCWAHRMENALTVIWDDLFLYGEKYGNSPKELEWMAMIGPLLDRTPPAVCEHEWRYIDQSYKLPDIKVCKKCGIDARQEGKRCREFLLNLRSQCDKFINRHVDSHEFHGWLRSIPSQIDDALKPSRTGQASDKV